MRAARPLLSVSALALAVTGTAFSGANAATASEAASVASPTTSAAAEVAVTASASDTYACVSSFYGGGIDLTKTVYDFGVSVSADLAASTAAGSTYALGAPSVQITAPAALLDLAHDNGYDTFHASSANVAYSTTFGSQTASAGVGALNFPSTSFDGSAPVQVSATGAATSVAVPASAAGSTGTVRTPDNTNVDDPWSSDPDVTVAFTVAVVLEANGFLKPERTALFRCGVDDVDRDGAVIQSVSVS